MLHGQQCGSLFIIWQEYTAVINSISHLFSVQLVSSVVRHGAAYFRATCISVCHPYKIRSARKCRRKFRRTFRDERVPSRQTIHNLVNTLRTTGLSTDNKQKHKRPVLTEEKLDDIGSKLLNTHLENH
jgi:hypothetical protein